MEISATRLSQAIQDVIAGQAPTEQVEAIGATLRELEAHLNISHERALQWLRVEISAKRIRPVRVWRDTIAGYRTRVPGYMYEPKTS